jgi:hypothetical protein
VDRVPDVPLQDAIGGWVVERTERSGDLAHEPARAPKHRRREVVEIPQRAALEVLHEPYVPAVRHSDVSTVSGPHRLRDGARQTGRDMLHGAILQVELRGAERLVGNLEHEPSPGPVEQEVLVLVAVERVQLALDAEAVASRGGRLGGRQPWRAQLVAGERIGAHHRLSRSGRRASARGASSRPSRSRASARNARSSASRRRSPAIPAAERARPPPIARPSRWLRARGRIGTWGPTR